MLKSDVEQLKLSREEILKKVNDFSNVTCENCGTKGNWLVFKVQLNDYDEVSSSFLINIIKEDGEISGGPESGRFSPAQIDIAFTRIRQKLDELKAQKYLSKDCGTAFILVDFLKDKPYSRCTILDIDGLLWKEVKEFVEAIYDSIPPHMK
ncbi:MAG TPA: hypothetical protein VK404_07115 [Spirosoma sp.]|nr:hypothetical protein [Spirosoma sp.]